MAQSISYKKIIISFFLFSSFLLFPSYFSSLLSLPFFLFFLFSFFLCFLLSLFCAIWLIHSFFVSSFIWFFNIDRPWQTISFSAIEIILNVHLKELNLLLVGETCRLGVVLRERDGSDLPNIFYFFIYRFFLLLGFPLL